MNFTGKTKIISQILSPSIKLWLSSQIENYQHLECQITGTDLEILRGYIPQVYLASTKAIYQGINLGTVEIKAQNIKINIGQVIQGKSLQLLEQIFIKGQVKITESELESSLHNSLLSQGLTDFLSQILRSQDISEDQDFLLHHQVSWQKLHLYPDKFVLQGLLTNFEGMTTPLMIRSGLALLNAHTLIFAPLCMEAPSMDYHISIQEFIIDLGSDVQLDQLILTQGEISCWGGLTINP